MILGLFYTKISHIGAEFDKSAVNLTRLGFVKGNYRSGSPNRLLWRPFGLTCGGQVNLSNKTGKLAGGQRGARAELETRAGPFGLVRVSSNTGLYY